MSRVRIPSELRPHADNRREVDIEGDTIDAILSNLAERYPSLGELLLGVAGGPGYTSNIYVNGRDVRELQALATPVGPHDTVVILRAMGGGT